MRLTDSGTIGGYPPFTIPRRYSVNLPSQESAGSTVPRKPLIKSTLFRIVLHASTKLTRRMLIKIILDPCASLEPLGHVE